MESPSLRFAEAVRTLGLEARRRGLRMPAFRSPPRLPDVARSLRRRTDGSFVIAIVLRGRPWPAVLADMVDGIIATNQLTGSTADAARAALWRAVSGSTVIAA